MAGPENDQGGRRPGPGRRPPPPPPGAGLDQLVDRGLERSGQGDVDGALIAWEQALAIDPEDVRAAAYVDYVRENYEMLAASPRPGEDEVPFGLGAVAGDDAYEVEVTRGDSGKVERYIESVDEGWFLDGEVGPALLSSPIELEAGPRVSAPVAVTFSPVAELDLGPPGPSMDDAAAGPPVRPSMRLPLPASSEATQPGGPMPEETITLEMEADEPDDRAPAMASDEEQTRDFVAGAASYFSGLPPDVELDFSDQRSAVPTREIPAPRGFVRPRGAGPAVAHATPAATPSALRQSPNEMEDADDDGLTTRPGRDPGGALDPIAVHLTPEAIAEFGGPGTDTGRAGPHERTRETPSMRVTIARDLAEQTGEYLEPPGDHGDDERTIERSASARVDTASETTQERGGASYTTPSPLDDAHEGRDASGRHPPLVIIEDPILGVAPPRETVRGRPVTDELSVGTTRVRGASAPAPSSTLGTVSTEAITASLEAAIEASALPDENRADRTRRRVTELIDRAIAASTSGDHATAIIALDIALAEDPESAVAQKLIHRHQPAILDVYQRFVGDLASRPALAMPMHELAGEKLDIRAAFLLSRIDGTLSFEEVLDVSGMQRPEAFRHLSILLLRGILEVR